MLKLPRLKKHHVSEIDQFLASLHHQYSNLSASQKAEVKKFTRIYQLRDTVIPDSDTKS